MPYVLAFLFVIKAAAPIISISWTAPHLNDAGWSLDKFDGRAPCSADVGGPDWPAHGHQDRGECICCASSVRDDLTAVTASLLAASYFLADLAPSSKAELDYEIVFWRAPGWTNAWSSRAPPAV
ncbi:hypothetical protein [Methylosinus sp. R-45379]|uniref:hypothetical protein n=1 Tax=Methylosinus sp. R-45379 TaxID=980563 RepID=UPI000A778464|nr:hypothetical protein [Methylosinus sp. R-45379]